jgi:hypothetical protein
MISVKYKRLPSDEDERRLFRGTTSIRQQWRALLALMRCFQGGLANYQPAR